MNLVTKTKQNKEKTNKKRGKKNNNEINKCVYN